MRKLAAILTALVLLCGIAGGFAEEEEYDGDAVALVVDGVEVTAAELEAEIRLNMFLAALSCAGYGYEYDITDPLNIEDETDKTLFAIELRMVTQAAAFDKDVHVLTPESEERAEKEAAETWERYVEIAMSENGLWFLPAGDYQVIDGDPEGNITRYFASFGLTKEVVLNRAREDQLERQLSEYVTEDEPGLDENGKIEAYSDFILIWMDATEIIENWDVITGVMVRLGADPSLEYGDMTDSWERSLMIGTEWYELGTDTLRSLEEDGWIWIPEEDGTFTFEIPGSGTCFRVRTADGTQDGKIVMMDMTEAAGIPVAYCGYYGEEKDDEGRADTLWDYLTEVYGAETDENGMLQAWVPMSDGTWVQVETMSRKVRLTLEAERP